MSEISLKDGSGNSYGLKIDSDARAHTRALALSHQHVVSSADQRAYQVSSSKAIAASEIKMLLLKNTSDTRELIVSYIRLETIGAAASNASAYWRIYLGGDYSSGGTATTPTNMFVGSAISAEGTFYDATASTIVTSGSPVEIDRTYRANELITYRKEGSIVLPKNGVLTVSWTGSTAAGTANCRVSFYYDEPEV
jgi:hypothetical protein